MKRVALGACVLAAAWACDDFHDDSTLPTSDGGLEPSRESGVTVDAAPVVDAGAPCDRRAPFVRFEPLRSISALGMLEEHPTLTADELRVYFQRAVPMALSGGVIMTASRASTAEDFGQPVELAELHAFATQNYLATPAVSPDGAHLAFGTFANTDQDHFYDVAVVDRQLGSSAFSDMPVRAAPLNSDFIDRSPAYQGDNTRIFFQSNRLRFDAGANLEVIYVAASPATGFDEPHVVMDVATNGPLLGYNPAPSADGTTLYFTRFNDAGQCHIFIGDLSSDALTVSNIEAINTPTGSTFAGEATNERTGQISADQCRLYFTIDDNLDGDADIWVASRR